MVRLSGKFARCERALGNDHELTYLATLDLGTCLLDENLVSEALHYLSHGTLSAERALGEDHALTIELRWRYAQAIYRHHFFGHVHGARFDGAGIERVVGFRAELLHSIYLHVTILDRSRFVLGRHHPLLVKVRASIKLCFAEQLDWTLDDFPEDLREIADRYL